VCAAAVLVLFAVGASSAAAASPWWQLNTSARPAILPSGGEGTIVVQGVNVGDAETSGPIALGLTLPEGVRVAEEGGVPEVQFLSFAFLIGSTPADLGPAGIFGEFEFCKVTAGNVLCSTEAQNPEFAGLEAGSPLAPFENFEIRVSVEDESGSSATPYRAEVSGGGGAPVSRQRPLAIGTTAPAFGAEDLSLVPEEEGGGLDIRAASHPFQLTATFNLDQGADPTRAPALPKDLHFKLPPGQLGNAVSLPQCTTAQFTTNLRGSRNLCPATSVLGVATVTVVKNLQSFVESVPVPLFNLEPKRGEPARFGFDVYSTPVILDTALRSEPGGDYGVTVDASNITQATNFLSSTLTFWGAPADPRHDQSRGWECLAGSFWVEAPERAEFPCNPSTIPNPPAFLTLPADCGAPFATTVEGISWPNIANPAGALLDPFTYSLHDEAGKPQPLVGCNKVPFAPTTSAEPTSNAATSPTGLNYDLDVHDEGLLNSEGLAQSEIKKAVVTLPEGFTTNPSVAEGLKACSQQDFEAATVQEGTGCPNESKIGDVEIESPLVKPIVHGSLYVAQQTQNPNHNLLTIYMIARNEEIGVLIRQAGKVEPNKVTGQLTTTFGTESEPIPQLPFSHFRLSFRQGQRSPLVTPPTCGNYTVEAELYPWSNPTVPLHEESSFKIGTGPEGQPCPQGTPPFHPNLLAGSENPTAGAYSPFYTEITRKDSEQEITRFSIKLPTGMIAKLKGVSECTDAQIALAKSREVEGGGGVEQASPACPQNSEVGHTQVGTGVGNVLAYAPGKLYLAGPYHGSPISLVSITAAKVGPFDLGTVVVRFALDVDHETAEVSVDGAASDPIPHIVDGIPIHLRDIQAFVDRPNFTLNPTSCAKKSTASTVLGSGLNFASSSDDVPVTVSSPFQVGNCASLGFKPKLALSLTGKKTHRGALPAFKAVLTYPKGGAYANIAAAQVTLPSSEFLEQGHLKNVCTRKVFETGANPGENCPKNSIYGKARAVTPLLDQPLEGPVYLRTGYGTKLPELAAALNGPQISITLAGKIDSVHKKGTEGSQIRNTFSVVPDAPVEKFTLELKGGKKGLLVNSTDVCKGTHKALAAFTGQNGKLDEYEPVLKAQCGKQKSKKSGAKKKSHK
jgi:hypothetical protein